MGDSVRKIAYFTMDVPNRHGEAAKVIGALADAGVNLHAFSGFPSGKKAQLDFIPKDVKIFKKAAKAAKINTGPKKTGFLVQGKDRKGAIANLLRTLAGQKINVTAIDAVSAGAGRYAAILWVKPKDITRTAKALGAK
jgi:hypothetical protein